MQIKTIIPILIWILVIPPGAVQALDTSWGVDINERFYVEENFFDTGTHRFEADDIYNIIHVMPWFSVSPNDGTTGYVSVDAKFEYYGEKELDDAGVELEELWASHAGKSIFVKAGLQTFRFGGGYVLYDEEPGISIQIQPSGGNIDLKLEGALVKDASPLAGVTLGFKPGFLEKINLFVIGFKDEDDLVAQALNEPLPGNIPLDIPVQNNTLQRNAPQGNNSQGNNSQGNPSPGNNPQVNPPSNDTPLSFQDSITYTGSGKLFWIGIEMDRFIKDFYLSAVMMYQHGTLDLIRNIEQEGRTWTENADMDISAYLADIGISYTISDRFSMEGFLYLESGDLNRAGGNIHQFIGIRPYLPRCSIFFNGGVDPFTEDSASIRSHTQAGVIAPGMVMDTQVDEKISFQLTGAVFFPEDAPSGKNWYGWEVDVLTAYEFKKNVTFYAEADFFRHGDMYESEIGVRPDNAVNLILGLDIKF